MTDDQVSLVAAGYLRPDYPMILTTCLTPFEIEGFEALRAANARAVNETAARRKYATGDEARALKDQLKHLQRRDKVIGLFYRHLVSGDASPGFQKHSAETGKLVCVWGEELLVEIREIDDELMALPRVRAPTGPRP